MAGACRGGHSSCGDRADHDLAISQIIWSAVSPQVVNSSRPAVTTCVVQEDQRHQETKEHEGPGF